VPRSLSRLADRLVSPEHARAAAAVRAHLAVYEQKRDLVAIGAYQEGADPRLDAALSRIEAIEAFLRQSSDARTELAATVTELRRLA
jgi:flagellar biosynthesis/type III secretory pathway ATPase